MKELMEHDPISFMSAKGQLGASRNAYYHGCGDGVRTIEMPTGLPQGEGASSYRYAMATQPFLNGMEAEASGNGIVRAYVDDITSVVDARNGIKMVDYVMRNGPANDKVFVGAKQMILLGVKASLEEAESIRTAYAEAGNIPINQILVNTKNLSDVEATQQTADFGLSVVGSPIGSFEFSRQYIQDKVNQFVNDCQRLKQMSEKQQIFAVLKYSLTQRFTYLFRTTYPSLMREFTPVIENAIKGLLEYILDIKELSETQWMLARLHTKDGGAGLFFMEDRLGPAYVASVTTSLAQIRKATPEISTFLKEPSTFSEEESMMCPKAIMEYLKEIKKLESIGATFRMKRNDNQSGAPKQPATAVSIANLVLASQEYGDSKELQRSLSEKQRERRNEAVDHYLTEKESKIIFLSGIGTAAGGFLDAIPSRSSGCVMSNDDFVGALCRRLQIQDASFPIGEMCNGCLQGPKENRYRVPIDGYGIHFQKCSRTQGYKMATHDHLTYLTYKMAKLAPGSRVNLEETLDSQTSNRRVDIVLTLTSGERIYCDFGVVNACSWKYFNQQTVYQTGDAAEKKEKDKATKYRMDSTNLSKHIIGLGIEVQGAWGPQMKKVFTSLVDAVAQATELPKAYIKMVWERRFSVTLQQGISRQINKAKLLQHRGASTEWNIGQSDYYSQIDNEDQNVNHIVTRLQGYNAVQRLHLRGGIT